MGDYAFGLLKTDKGREGIESVVRGRSAIAPAFTMDSKDAWNPLR